MLELQMQQLPNHFFQLEELVEKEAALSKRPIYEFWPKILANFISTAPAEFPYEAVKTFWSFYRDTKNNSPYVVDESGFSPLHTAAKLGYDVYLQYLLRGLQVEQINPTNNSRYTPAHLAASFGHLACLKVLDAAGADLNLLLNNGGSCLTLAASQGYLDIVNYLLTHPRFKQIAAIARPEGTALHCAIAAGHLNCVEALLPKLKNRKDNHGNSPLHCCILANRTDLFEKLLPVYSELINVGNGENTTPLMMAVEHKNLKMTLSLLEKGASCNLFARDGNDAISTAFKNYFDRRPDPNAKPILDAVIAHAVDEKIDLSVYQWHLKHLTAHSHEMSKELRQFSAQLQLHDTGMA